MLFNFTVVDRLTKNINSVKIDVTNSKLNYINDKAKLIGLELSYKQLIYIAYIAGLNVPDQLFRMVDLDCWERGEGKTTAEVLAFLCLPNGLDISAKEAPVIFSTSINVVREFESTAQRIYMQLEKAGALSDLDATLYGIADLGGTLTVRSSDAEASIKILFSNEVNLNNFFTCRAIVID